MPIGKNAIKRVENNGYSNVKTSAPDMENSSVIAKPDEQVVEKMIAPVEKATAAKATAKNFVPIFVLSPFYITDFTDCSVKVYHIPAGFSIILLARHKIRG